jgi:hypothetical protein
MIRNKCSNEIHRAENQKRYLAIRFMHIRAEVPLVSVPLWAFGDQVSGTKGGGEVVGYFGTETSTCLDKYIVRLRGAGDRHRWDCAGLGNSAHRQL